ncbi:MAG: hypothetical protein WC980_01460 [Candidatus Brocadiia bacterium]
MAFNWISSTTACAVAGITADRSTNWSMSAIEFSEKTKGDKYICLTEAERKQYQYEA